ncbi:hypothetical protein GCM10009069_30210 [Algimonas arctica]|uniref:Uncharacterized protein n=1 Tax=Algimonas arctica TaxID=1479486 RepID=A0A8J3CUZ3_9PROT|nr:hypothetical protein [Algimonas arctica]GHB05858.1 hypothetical protein GCM10009069_30210 [Algimonas arctica]
MFDLTEERNSGLAKIDVRGNSGDVVDLTLGNFTYGGQVTDGGVIYDTYSEGNAIIRIEAGVTVVLPEVFRKTILSLVSDVTIDSLLNWNNGFSLSAYDDEPIAYDKDIVLFADVSRPNATTESAFELATIKSNVHDGLTPAPVEGVLDRADLVFTIEAPINALLIGDDTLEAQLFADEAISFEDDAALVAGVSGPKATLGPAFELATIKSCVHVGLNLEVDVESSGGDIPNLTPVTDLSLEADTMIESLLIWDHAISLSEFEDGPISSGIDAGLFTILGDDLFESLSVEPVGDGQDRLGIFESLGVDDFGVVPAIERSLPYEEISPELLDFMDDLMLFVDDGLNIDTGMPSDA